MSNQRYNALATMTQEELDEVRSMLRKPCKVPTCDTPARSRGMCDRHYRSWCYYEKKAARAS